jgi:hypothetical protein
MSETSARAIRCARALGSREPKTGAGAAPATVGVGGPDRSCVAPPPGAAPCAAGADGPDARGAGGAGGAGGLGGAAGAGADGAACTAGCGAGGAVGCGRTGDCGCAGAACAGAGCADPAAGSVAWGCAAGAVCTACCAGADAAALATVGAVCADCADCAKGACAAPLRAPLRVTANVALQRAQRARTPAAGTRAGSTRNTVSQLGQRMFIAPSKPLTHLRWPASGHRILRHPTGGRPRRQNRAVSWRTSSSRLPVH